MLKNFILVLFVLIRTNSAFTQASDAKFPSTSKVAYNKDFAMMYAKCQDLRLDATHKIFIDFMRKYAIRTDLKKLNIFCFLLYKKCNEDGNDGLKRRIEIIELTNTLNLSGASIEKINVEFKKLFSRIYNDGDFSAALECLYEQAGIIGKSNEKIETLKILFFCEKFAISYKLKNDLCYQKILLDLGQKLLYFDKNSEAIVYFKKSLATQNSSTMDSLISLNGIGMGYQKLKQFNQSTGYLKKASKTALNAKNFLFNHIIYGSIAANNFSTGNLDDAYRNAYLEKNASVKNELWVNCVASMCLLAKIELKRDNSIHAKVLMDSVNLLIRKTNNKDVDLRMKQNEIVYLYNQKTNNDKAALLAYQKFIHYEKLFENAANKDRISLLQFQAGSNIFNLEMDKIAARKKIKDFLIVLSIIVLGIVVSWLLHYFLKKINTIEKVKEEFQELNKQQSAEIAILRKELMNQLEVIKSSYAGFQHNNDDILKLKEFNLSKKEQWKSFEQLFYNTYPYFQTIIKVKLEKTTPSELRLIMLHKLGLNNKEISASLFITLEGVKKANYRLYKKLNVTSSAELVETFS